MFEQQISILESILKENVSLRFTLMAAENSYQINYFKL